ncbi:helix-turn-helix domain-containing protein [Mucilaginibacter gossypii]|uniref:winged helix-turn-helix transcriptional regulator n=1 Tax=Mucilaginibacter gossypii TaxID=551996 RepID=UPI000DCB2373|nr:MULTISPECIES: helix-turn-helix domain-containing protein [Mucilaginibacter]QTE37606.1 helix-turn-helix domain-containing protein [Mucilaginibacter gossypii]RAV58449.1 transcriptional regulator [Mucilaginibacter rubeus]
MKKIKKRSACPISFSLDFLGDKWTLLIVRDILLNNKNTFGEFLQSAEGIATNVLTDRLKMLETEGFIMKYPVPGKARVAYCLAERGIALIPIIMEMAIWGVSENNTEIKKELTAALKNDKEAVLSGLAKKHLAMYEQRKESRIEPDQVNV